MPSIAAMGDGLANIKGQKRAAEEVARALTAVLAGETYVEPCVEPPTPQFGGISLESLALQNSDVPPPPPDSLPELCSPQKLQIAPMASLAGFTPGSTAA